MTLELLHCHNYNNVWIGSDTEERYQENLKSQALDLPPTHGFEYAKYALISVQRSWSCPQLHYCWDLDTAKFLGLPRMANKLYQARDCLHDGPKTLKSYARQWYYKLLSQLFN
jgi:hypothetical protein